jgi:LacI family transcriptional regulator
MTLQQVANHAGVSASTVSRVINAVPGIRAETIEAVHRSMRALSYAPGTRSAGEPVITDLTGAKVAFAVLYSNDTLLPAYESLLRGVSAGAARFKLDLQVLLGADVQSTVDQLIRAEFDGLVLHGMIDSIQRSEPLHEIPTVWVLGNRRRPTWGDQVMPDNTTIGQIAAQYLLSRGHRRAMYFGISNGWSVGIRMLSFQQGVEDAGGTTVMVSHKPDAAGRVKDAEVANACEALVKAYRQTPERPTGLFISEDWLVRHVYNSLKAASITPGRDLTIISCNNDRPYLVGVDPVPATIDIRHESIGLRAIEQLCSRIIHRGESDRLRMMVEPQLVLPPTGA